MNTAANKVKMIPGIPKVRHFAFSLRHPKTLTRVHLEPKSAAPGCICIPTCSKSNRSWKPRRFLESRILPAGRLVLSAFELECPQYYISLIRLLILQAVRFVPRFIEDSTVYFRPHIQKLFPLALTAFSECDRF